MITIPRTWAMLAGLLVSLIAVPMAVFGTLEPAGSSDAMAFFVVLAELAVYFVLTIFSSRSVTIASSAVVSFTFLVLRFAGSFAAALLFTMLHAGPTPGVIELWVGNPLSVLIQIVVLVLLGTHVLAAFLPEAIGSDVAAQIAADGRDSGSSRPAQQSGQQVSASGGFVQVYSYEELSSMLRKTQGLEGFVILSSEGLIVWRDLPVRIELDTVVARTLSLMDQFGGMMESSGLTRVRRVMVESKEHLLFATPLNLNFGLLMLFSSRTPTEEILAKVGFISKTSREFVQWKYPALPLATGLSQERNPLITT